jgi:hypothetical protein
MLDATLLPATATAAAAAAALSQNWTVVVGMTVMLHGGQNAACMTAQGMA